MALDSHANIARCNQSIGESLRCRDRTSEHFRFPHGAREFELRYAQRPAPLLVQCIEDRLGIDLVRAGWRRCCSVLLR